MKLFFKLFGLMFVLCFASFANAQGSSQASAEKQLSDLLNNLTTFSANFDQRVYSSQGAVLQNSSGKMDLSRPGKFRWEILKPNHQILIANGDKLSIYDIALEQVTLQNLANQSSVSPAQLLTGSTTELAKSFTISKISGKPNAFKLTPKEEDAMFSSVELDFSAKGQLQRMALFDNLGQATILSITQAKMNPKLNAKLFEFTPPKGVDVIDETQGQ